MAIETYYLFWDIDQNTQMSFYQNDNITEKYLYSPGINTGHPSETDVRNETIFGPNNELTGTLAVPSPSNVASGVPTDDTV
jgi:hypothetical protein